MLLVVDCIMGTFSLSSNVGETPQSLICFPNSWRVDNVLETVPGNDGQFVSISFLETLEVHMAKRDSSDELYDVIKNV